MASLPGQNGPLHQLSRHYRAEQRKLAIETYIKFDLSAADTVAELGCPTRHSLKAWYKDYLEHGDVRIKGDLDYRSPMQYRKDLGLLAA